jgi:ABC-type enterobactin transport system permease subunit
MGKKGFKTGAIIGVILGVLSTYGGSIMSQLPSFLQGITYAIYVYTLAELRFIMSMFSLVVDGLVVDLGILSIIIIALYGLNFGIIGAIFSKK